MVVVFWSKPDNGQMCIGLVPVLGVRLQMHCVGRAGLVPAAVLGARLRVHYANRDGLVPVLCVWLQVYCVDRAGLVPVLGARL